MSEFVVNTVICFVVAIGCLMLLLHGLLTIVGAKKVVPNMLKAMGSALVNAIAWIVERTFWLIGRMLRGIFYDLPTAIYRSRQRQRQQGQRQNNNP